MIHHLLCYQGLAVANYGFAFDAADLANLRLSLNLGITNVLVY
jgi:hypothetical protein